MTAQHATPHDSRCENLPGGKYHGQTIGGGSDGFRVREPMPIPCHCAAREDGRRAAARARRRAAMPDYAGLREYHKSRSTGTHIGIYDGIEAGMDTDGGRWQTVCEEHATVISHLTLAAARFHAAVPLEWCEVCNGQFDPDNPHND